MRNVLLLIKNVVLCVLVLSVPAFAGQIGAGAGAGVGTGAGSGAGSNADQATSSSQATAKAIEGAAKEKVEQAKAVAAKIEEAQSNNRFVRTLTNVQVELTLTDQVGTAAAEKKTVSMIVASGNWGKIRSSGTYRPTGEPPLIAELNVDARPLIALDGPIQLELTVIYNPPGAARIEREDGKARPSGINQSQTVVLQSGKPLIISQAADPVSDRKVVVEVKATVLK
jgi:hypothetical protein